MDTKCFGLMRSGLRWLAAVSVLSAIPSAEARAEIWTHAASACAVDETSAAKYEVNAARFMVKGGAMLPATVVARCNVTQARDSGVAPYWNWLEVTYRDPDGTHTGNQVKALLYRVSNATGGIVLLATFDSNALPATGDNTDGVLFGGIIDFFRYAYFVEIQVKRTDDANGPTISNIRLVETVF